MSSCVESEWTEGYREPGAADLTRRVDARTALGRIHDSLTWGH